jgi:hypothetical protein
MSTHSKEPVQVSLAVHVLSGLPGRIYQRIHPKHFLSEIDVALHTYQKVEKGEATLFGQGIISQFYSFASILRMTGIPRLTVTICRLYRICLAGFCSVIYGACPGSWQSFRPRCIRSRASFVVLISARLTNRGVTFAVHTRSILRFCRA